MREHPILFSAPMVRSILEGRKTQTPRAAFSVLWDSINAKRGFGWNENPWVWALTFKRVEE